MTHEANPFADDSDRHALWEMLVHRDIDAFLSRDWSMVAGDFLADRFMGIHAQFLTDPDAWRLEFPTLDAYRDEWLRQAADTAATAYGEPLRAALFRATTLRDIDVQGDRAVLHKKLNGNVARADGTSDRLLWQTLYFCTRTDGQWRISGFVGYMPYRLGN